MIHDEKLNEAARLLGLPQQLRTPTPEQLAQGRGGHGATEWCDAITTVILELAKRENASAKN